MGFFTEEHKENVDYRSAQKKMCTDVVYFFTPEEGGFFRQSIEKKLTHTQTKRISGILP